MTTTSEKLCSCDDPALVFRDFDFLDNLNVDCPEGLFCKPTTVTGTAATGTVFIDSAKATIRSSSSSSPSEDDISITSSGCEFAIYLLILDN